MTTICTYVLGRNLTVNSKIRFGNKANFNHNSSFNRPLGGTHNLIHQADSTLSYFPVRYDGTDSWRRTERDALLVLVLFYVQNLKYHISQKYFYL